LAGIVSLHDVAAHARRSAIPAEEIVEAFLQITTPATAAVPLPA